ncbi:MAG: hypothetical protein AB7U63_16090 [Porticoccaceae bacterium]
MMTGTKKATNEAAYLRDTKAGQGCSISNNSETQNTTNNSGCNGQKITFPNGRNRTHALAILAMLIRGDECDQFAYHEATGYPIADFRTRVSELGRNHGWQIDRAWTHATDHNGQVQRCKHYWLDPEWLAQVYAENPELERRCKALAYGEEVSE